jgi:phenylacetate-coenzyme A ligase PaaK-like adenylate-forming protein
VRGSENWQASLLRIWQTFGARTRRGACFFQRLQAVASPQIGYACTTQAVHDVLSVLQIEVWGRNFKHLLRLFRLQGVELV